MIQFRHAAYLLRKNVINVSKRSLFSDRFTFLDGFVKLRLNTSISYPNGKSETEFIHEIENATISTLIRSTKFWTLDASGKAAHIELLHRSWNRLHENCSEIQHPQDFIQFEQLGQMTMRLFDHLEMPEKALQFYHEFDNCSLDSSIASFILMNLLFKQQRYDDVLKVYQIRTIERERESTTLHKTLVYAACYKLNTYELLQYSMNVRKTCKSIEDKRKGRYFEVMLALNQNQFELAIMLAGDDDSFLANNIRLLAMAELNDWAGVCDLLYKIKMNRLNGTRYRVSMEVLQRMKQCLNLAKPKLARHEYNRCCRFIQEFTFLRKLVLHKKTMDEWVCEAITRDQSTEDLSAKNRKLR